MYASPQAFRQMSRITGMYTDIGVQGAASDSSGHALISMLFEGALASLAQARGALAAGQLDIKARAVAKAARIVDEGLRASLNLKDGGAIATDLDGLYRYIEVRLTQGNLKNDDAALDECVRLLRPLADAWAQIAPQVRSAS